MGIKNHKGKDTISKQAIERRESCTASAMTVVFSFHHLSEKEDYNFRYFEKKAKKAEASNAIVQFIEKIAEFSKMTWEQLYQLPKKSGLEYLDAAIFEESFINSINIPIAKDDKLIVVRFNGQNSRFVMKRGTKCSRVAHILGIDYDMKLYNH
nr:MAG TPA: hypothetical protein [Caudoviricetes sp.]